MLAKAMDESREVPTATSFRTIAVDTLDAKRKALNKVLNERGMKVSFTHVIAWAIAQAAKGFPVMVRSFEERDGKPVAIEGGPVNLGIAVDVERKDGSHSLMVPAIKGADGLDFAGFHSYYEELINKTRENKLTADDFQGTNISLTNPGGIGTVASVPRLMKGQSAIIATGSIAYPPEWAHASPDRLRALGVSKVMTLTSTYDHRVIQGAESGAFLRRIEQLLQGEDGFYEAIAADLGVEAGADHRRPRRLRLGAAARRRRPDDGPGQPDQELLQGVQAATSLLKAYRTHGHLAARLDPLGREPKGDPALEPENLNLTPELMARIPASILRIGVPGETLLEVLPRMRETYCGTIGYQFEHLSSHGERMWLREMVETGAHTQPLEQEEKKRLLHRLIDVFQFERFVEKAYLGQKIFTIEGLDAVVPMLDELVTLAYRDGAEEVVFGMAHRGRLAVLAHNLGRSVESILAEFEGAKQIEAVKAVAAIPHGGTGDVKYHYGHQGVYETSEGEKIAVRLYPNPSHLEFVNPVVEGATRFIQSDFEGPKIEHQPKRAVPGPAARRRRLPRPGGRRRDAQPAGAEGLLDRRHDPRHPEQPGGLHHRPRGRPLDPLRGRHGEGVQHPDHPRQRRRRRGLLVGDPAGDGLPRALGTGHRHRRDRLPPLRPQRDRRARLHAAADRGQDQGPPAGLRDLRREAGRRGGRHARGRRADLQRAPHRDVDGAQGPAQEDGARRIRRPDRDHLGDRRTRPQRQPAGRDRGPDREAAPLNEALIQAPESFTIHRKLRKPLAKRIDALENGGIEFGHAEALAYASLLTEGVHIRLTGQDTERGTFSHRHLVLHDEKTGLEYCPMQNLEDANAPFELYNSPLSETACLGFEYGYSAATPNALVLWEAQYGDFANAGQVIIDSFIASGEAKWGQTSRLTLLLPHGYEGSGPEHSSARIERFLALAAEGNIRIANPTTAAQYFHLLRRQALIRKPRPLVVFTPKGLLRLNRAAATPEELTEGELPLHPRRPDRPRGAATRSSAWSSAPARSTSTWTPTSVARPPTPSRSPGSS